MVSYRNGDILSIDTSQGKDMILHICDCTSLCARRGLSRDVFNMYPSADVYKNRTEESRPGTVNISHPIINLFGRYRCKKATFPLTKAVHFIWFSCGLDQLLKQLKQLPQKEICINIPYKIGCDSMRDWEKYLNEIEQFRLKLPLHITVRIWRSQPKVIRKIKTADVV